MQALMKVAPGKGNLELREIPEPVAGPGEVVVRVAATGICGTDLHIQDDEYAVPPPVVIGHETAGEVASVGQGVTGVRPGDRVTSLTTITTCRRLRPLPLGAHQPLPPAPLPRGARQRGLRRVLRRPPGQHPAPPGQRLLRPAAMTEPLACCVHGVMEVAPPARGSLAVVSGPGPIGLLCAQVARAAGAEVIVLGTAADTGRFAVARSLGFEHLVDVQAGDPVAAVRDIGGGREPDLLVEAAGAASSMEGCLRMAPRGGTVLQIGLYGRPVPVALDTLVLKEIHLLGSFSSTPTSWPLAMDLLARRRRPRRSAGDQQAPPRGVVGRLRRRPP